VERSAVLPQRPLEVIYSAATVCSGATGFTTLFPFIFTARSAAIKSPWNRPFSIKISFVR